MKKIIIISMLLLTGCKEDHIDTNNIEPVAEDNIQLKAEAIRQYALTYGVSITQAKSNIDILSEVETISENIEKIYGSSLSDIYFDNKNFSINILTTNNLEDSTEFLNYTNKQGKDYIIKANIKNQQTMNRKDRELFLSNLNKSNIYDIKGLQGFSYNTLQNKLNIDVMSEYEFSEINKNKLNELKNFLGNIDFQINYTNIENKVVAANSSTPLIAGAEIRTPPVPEIDPLPGKCTSGFAVNVDGIDGVLTARHCFLGVIPANAFASYYAPLVEGNNRLVLQGIVEDRNFYTSGQHDIMFLSNNKNPSQGYVYQGDPYLGKVKYTMDSAHTLTKEQNILGTWVCKYGQKTGYTCGEVIEKNYYSNAKYGCGRKNTYGNNNSCEATLIRVSSPYFKCDGGDSGAPVFSFISEKEDLVANGILSQCIAGREGLYSSIEYMNTLGSKVYLKSGV